MPRLWFILFPCCWFWLLVHGYGSKIRPKLSNILVMCGIELLNIQFPICRYLMLIHIHSQTSMFHPIYIYIYTFNYHHFYVLRSYIYIFKSYIWSLSFLFLSYIYILYIYYLHLYVWRGLMIWPCPLRILRIWPSKPLRRWTVKFFRYFGGFMDTLW